MNANLEQFELEIIASIGPAGCKDGVCPTVYKSKDGRFFVQGSDVPHEVLQAANVPNGESLVEVPKTLLENLIARSDRLLN